MRVHAHDEIDDLVAGDLGPPMRRVGRNDHDVAGTELTAFTADHLAAACMRVCIARGRG